ncbi:uncharacterized protein [Halyomorpha halys]|uniref:uncharacterized protein isoform X3 n=1 Tax=Halyomorpha halys TaxID=286706 RepID=UPI0034D33160
MMATHKQMSRVSGEATKKTSLIQELIKSNAEQEANSKKKMELFKSAGFEMRPDLSKKFRSLSIQNIINKVLNDNLYGQTYSSDTAEELTKSLATTIRQKLEGIYFLCCLSLWPLVLLIQADYHNQQYQSLFILKKT